MSRPINKECGSPLVPFKSITLHYTDVSRFFQYSEKTAASDVLSRLRMNGYLTEKIGNGFYKIDSIKEKSA